MKSKSLKHRYYHWELGAIQKYFPFKSDTIPKTSLTPLKLLNSRINKYYSDEINFAQNVNLSMSTISENIVSTTLILERIVKACKKDKVSIEERHQIELNTVVTYAFFTDEAGNIVNVESYIPRIKEALDFLIDFFEKHHQVEGTNAYANCKTFYMHLGTIHKFVGDLLHIFLSKPIK